MLLSIHGVKESRKSKEMPDEMANAAFLLLADYLNEHGFLSTQRLARYLYEEMNIAHNSFRRYRSRGSWHCVVGGCYSVALTGDFFVLFTFQHQRRDYSVTLFYM